MGGFDGPVCVGFCFTTSNVVVDCASRLALSILVLSSEAFSWTGWAALHWSLEVLSSGEGAG